MKKIVYGLLIISTLLLIVGCKNDKVDYKKYGDVEVEVLDNDELYENLTSYNILDIRDSDEYNGWNYRNLIKNGHIKNAINFPASLLTGNYNNSELLNLYNKLVESDKGVIIYGQREEALTSIVGFLSFNKIENFKVYDNDMSNIVSDDRFEFEVLENYEKLVSAKWVNDLIGGREVLNSPNNNYVIIYANWGDETQSGYNDGHVAGSYHMNTDEVEEVNPENDYDKAPLWNLKSNEKLIEVAKKYGIKTDTTLILHSNDTTAATRVAFAFMYLGVEDVRVLDGGVSNYKRYFDVEKSSNVPTRIDNTDINGETIKGEYLVNSEVVKSKLQEDNFILASVRSGDEHNGKTSGYNYINSKGRIPGDVWINSGNTAYDMVNYRMLDNTMLNYKKIEKMWAGYGLSMNKEITFYCGTGWRATEAFFYAYLIGYENIKLYDGGWLEWSDYYGNEIA